MLVTPKKKFLEKKGQYLSLNPNPNFTGETGLEIELFLMA